MTFRISKIMTPCNSCSGFGVFSNDCRKLTHCSKCGSIHAESLGLKFNNNTLENTFIYVILPLGNSLNARIQRLYSEAKHKNPEIFPTNNTERQT